MSKKFYVKEGEGEFVEVLPINKFASLLNITLTTARDCLTRKPDPDAEIPANRVRRPLKHIRDGCNVWVYASELSRYPFIRSSNVYHYVWNEEEGEWEKKLCEKCSYGQPCFSGQPCNI